MDILIFLIILKYYNKFNLLVQEQYYFITKMDNTIYK